MSRRRLPALVLEHLPDEIVDRVPAQVRAHRRQADWEHGLLLAGIALGACLVTAGALAWISRQTGVAVDKIAFNFPYDDEENWFV